MLIKENLSVGSMHNEERIGILLTNIGSPDSPSVQDVRGFLSEFLSDERIIRLPPWIWQPILQLFILHSRPKHSARLYNKIWGETGSPLISSMESLSTKVEKNLTGETQQTTKVLPAMRYGKPSFEEQIKELNSWGANRTIVFPLFPQYSTTTTESAIDSVRAITNGTTLEIVKEYYNHPKYLQAISDQINISLGDKIPEAMLFSFHGIPETYLDENPDYKNQCEETAYSIGKRVGLNRDKIVITYQSRFGPIRWIKPYTEQILIKLAQGGIRNIAVVTPGFSVECLETLEEINTTGRDVFLSHGGESYIYVPTLNDSDAHVEMISEILQNLIH